MIVIVFLSLLDSPPGLNFLICVILSSSPDQKSINTVLFLEQSPVCVWTQREERTHLTTEWWETWATSPSGEPATPAPPATRMFTPRSRCLEQTGSPGTDSASGAPSWDARKYLIYLIHKSKKSRKIFADSKSFKSRNLSLIVYCLTYNEFLSGAHRQMLTGHTYYC